MRIKADSLGADNLSSPCRGSGAERDETVAKRKVVLVDDHEDSLLALSAALRLFGYEVHTASDGAAGLELAEQHQADVMIVDIVMPRMSGFEVAKQARQRLGSDIKLIALSGYGERNNRQKGIDAGFNYYLLKPVTAENLVPYIGP